MNRFMRACHNSQITIRTLVALVGLLTLSAMAHAEDKVLTWAAIELPPITIFNTPNLSTLKDLGNGSADVAVRAIANHMPGYEHKVIGTSATRAIGEMAAGKPLCVAATLMSPEILSVAYLTSRGITPPSHLIIRKNDAERITQNAKSVSLEKLLQRKDLTGMIDAKRPQGKRIDELTAKANAQLKKVTNTHFTANYASLMKRIDTGEMDYTLELPYVMEYYNRKKVFSHEMLAVPLEESLEPNIAYVGCTRSLWGEKMIREIDTAILAAIREDKGNQSSLSGQGIRQALLYWLPDNLKTEYAAHLDAYFKQRLAEPAPATK